MAAKKKKTLRSGFTETNDKVAELKALALKVNGALGQAGAVYLGTEQREFERIKTGIVALDYVLGGGLVKGQMVVFSGEESSFKTSAALMAASSVQAQGGTVVWVAGEGFDRAWAESLGVTLDDIVIIAADTGDQAMEAAITMVQSGLVDLMVMDSFQSLGTTREMDAGVDDEAYAGAGAPQMWGRVMRKWFSLANAGSKTAAIGISQVRAPIGRFSPTGAPDPESTGIWAIKHWKAAEIKFRKGEIDHNAQSGEAKRMNGREFKLKCTKNKTASSERQASFKMKYEDGYPVIDNFGTLFRLAKSYDLIDNKGAWFEGYNLRAQGEEKFMRLLEEDEDALEQLRDDLYELLER